MKTAFASVMLVAAAADSAATDVVLNALCTDDTPTSSIGCMSGAYTTVDSNSALSWKWMLSSKTRSGLTSSITANYAFCNYLMIPYGTASMMQTLVDCGVYVSADNITETVQTYDSLESKNTTTYSHWYSSTSSFLGGSSATKTETWMADADVDFTIAMDSTNKWIEWSSCAMRPFEDTTLALTAGETMNVMGSSHIWKSNSATSSTTSRQYWGQNGSAVSVTILDKVADAASAIAATATVAAVVALSF